MRVLSIDLGQRANESSKRTAYRRRLTPALGLMGFIVTSAVVYLFFGVPVFVAGAVGSLLLRKHFHLRHVDWLLLVLPWLVWFGLMLFAGGNKSLSNLVEAFYLGCITAALFVARLGLSAWLPRRQVAFGALALACSCVVAVSLWAFVPALPE